MGVRGGVGGKAEDCELELGTVAGRVHGFLVEKLEENAGGSSGVCVGVFYYLLECQGRKGTTVSECLCWMLRWVFAG